MKAKKLTILIILCVCVFLAFLIVSSLDVTKDITSNETYHYVDQNATDNVRVFTFDMALEGEISFTHSSDNGWCLDQSENIPLDETKVRALISTFATVIATKKIDEPSSDLSEYGLDDPSYSVSIKISGKIKSYSFGNYHNTLNSYYFKAKNSSDIYLVPSSYVEDLKISVLDLLLPNEIPNLDNIQSVEFTSINGAVTNIKNEENNELIAALSSLKIDYAVGYGEKYFETFSLDKPATAVVEYLDKDQKSQTVTLYFGRGDSDNITYILSPNTSIICVIKCDNIGALLAAIDQENS